MKKIFLFLLISIFMISLVSAWYYSDSHTYGEATAAVRIEGYYPICEGNAHGSYCVGNYVVKNLQWIGDKYYLGFSYTSWPSADINGYSGIPKASCSGSPVCRQLKLTLPIKDGHPVGYIMCAWDYHKAWNGDWTWVGKCAGYFINTFGLKVVECYDNSDCSSGQICDKSGDWTTWSCKTDPCKYITCDDYCRSSIRGYNGYCKDGECVYQTETCTYGCLGKLCAEDPCKGVICDDKCENSIWYHNGHCVNGNCVYLPGDTCLYGCQNEPSPFLAVITGQGMCRDDPCIEGIVTCEDYCSETSLFYDGKCIGGKCVQFKEKQYAEECGFAPPPIVLAFISQFFSNIWDWIKGIFGG